jgi:hypothetical protein
MMRLLGVLVGSALAVAALVVFIGVPEFTTENSVAGNTVITLPMRTEAATVAAPEPLEAVAAETTPVVPAPVSIDDSATATAESVTEIETETTVAMPEEASDISVLENSQQWYAFWSPFRSEIAASGFVDQLQRVTGLDYRVVKIKPGVYEVAFAYIDDAEITDNLSQITAATGLQLPEG